MGDTEYVGYSGTGSFSQWGGSNSMYTYFFYLGANAGSSGTYILGGSGRLLTPSEYIGGSGSGVFTQSGGTHTVVNDLYLGANAGSSGTYTLSGSGLLSTPAEFVGNYGSGSFTQTGGTHSVGSALYLGYDTGGTGTYSLGGNGLLSAAGEFLGYIPGSTGLFQQTGGSNAVGSLLVGSGGCYQLGGGTLQVTGGFFNGGIVDGRNTPATLIANCLLDLSSGTWTNLSALSLSMGSNSLLIIPPGFSFATLGHYSSLGLVHTAGSTLTLYATQGFTGCGTIGDLVNCQGSITACSSGFINLNGGLTLSGSAAVNLGSGSLTANGAASGISGGLLSAANQYVGYAGTGLFTQSGGTNTFVNRNGYLYLGYGPGDSGTYILSGSALLSSQNTNGNQIIGYAGTGTFTQLGGTNSIGPSTNLILGYNAGASGTYSLSAGLLSAPIRTVASTVRELSRSRAESTRATPWLSVRRLAPNGSYTLSGGLLSETSEDAGSNGTGNFAQSGGTNTISYFLYVAGDSGSSGTYSLSGTGRLSDQQVDMWVITARGSLRSPAEPIPSPNSFSLAANSGGSGTYNLNGGLLILSALSQVPVRRPSTSAAERFRLAARFPPACP